MSEVTQEERDRSERQFCEYCGGDIRLKDGVIECDNCDRGEGIKTAAQAAVKAERELVINFLDRMKVQASELGQPDAVFWIVQIRRAIASGEHEVKK